MEEKTSEEREGALVAFDPPQGLSPAALEKEKNLFWWSSLLDCFYTGLAVFERADLKQTKGIVLNFTRPCTHINIVCICIFPGIEMHSRTLRYAGLQTAIDLLFIVVPGIQASSDADAT